ncbi:MAG: ribosome maturation factor RimP [SAR324 cluster bacterium]|nr:ribosome maturation factor RimP [SAR324 cluster bacterium]
MSLSDEQNKFLTEAITPLAESLELELFKLELVQEDGVKIFRVTVDKDAGVGVYDIQKLSKRLSPLLEVEDPFSFAYTLEVSSPGIFRELLRTKDFERFKGDRIRIKNSEDKSFTGILQGLEEGNILVDIDGTTNRFEWATMSKVNLSPDLQPNRKRQ